jgi:hypothetical protein
VIQPNVLERQVRVPNPRTARAATQRRKVSNSRARYTSIVRVTVGLIAALSLLMAYVVLTSNLTGLNYAVDAATQQRDALLADTARLDTQLAQQRGDERLAQIAAKLGMHEPARVSVVRLAPPATQQRHFGFPGFASIASLFAPAPASQSAQP